MGRRNEGVRAEEGEKEREGEQEGEEGTLAMGEKRTLAVGAEVNFGSVDAAEGQRGAEGQAGLGRNSVQQLGIWTPREYTARTNLTPYSTYPPISAELTGTAMIIDMHHHPLSRR